MSKLPTPDELQVEATLAAMAAFTDRRDWERLEGVFAEAVRVDYTSLWGGEPELTPRADLLAAWRGLVPGFDATRHQLGEIDATVIGDTATVTAAIRGTHLLDGQAWIIAGRYEAQLVRADGWRIAALTLVADSEEGDRALTEEARRRAGS